jgi:hypothetical protein
LSFVSSATDQVIDAAVGVDFHRAEIGETLDQPGVFAELLTERVTQVVGWIRRDQQDGFPRFGHLDREGAGSRRLSHTTFSSHKDPPQRLLIDQILEGRVEGVVVGADNSSRHLDRRYQVLLCRKVVRKLIPDLGCFVAGAFSIASQ